MQNVNTFLDWDELGVQTAAKADTPKPPPSTPALLCTSEVEVKPSHTRANSVSVNGEDDEKHSVFFFFVCLAFSFYLSLCFLSLFCSSTFACQINLICKPSRIS